MTTQKFLSHFNLTALPFSKEIAGVSLHSFLHYRYSRAREISIESGNPRKKY